MQVHVVCTCGIASWPCSTSVSEQLRDQEGKGAHSLPFGTGRSAHTLSNDDGIVPGMVMGSPCM